MDQFVMTSLTFCQVTPNQRSLVLFKLATGPDRRTEKQKGGRIGQNVGGGMSVSVCVC